MVVRETAESIREGVLRWVREWVVAENLCPFARPVLNRDLIGVTVIDDCATDAVLQAIVDEALQLLSARNEEATALLVLGDRSVDFDTCLDLVAMADALLDELTDGDELQLVAFHPDFRFEGALEEDPANAVNRSPWPLVHLLQRASVTRAIERHPDIAGIPERNRRHLSAMSRDALARATAR